jgi:phenylacetate-CoA ligase
VAGRTDDMLIVRGVNVFPSEIERVLMEVPDLAPQYQIAVDRQGALDTIEVHAEVTAEFSAAALQDVGTLAALRERVNSALDAALGISTDVVLHPPGSLPRSEGKAVRVHDRRLS